MADGATWHGLSNCFVGLITPYTDGDANPPAHAYCSCLDAQTYVRVFQAGTNLTVHVVEAQDESRLILRECVMHRQRSRLGQVKAALASAEDSACSAGKESSCALSCTGRHCQFWPPLRATTGSDRRLRIMEVSDGWFCTFVGVDRLDGSGRVGRVLCWEWDSTRSPQKGTYRTRSKRMQGRSYVYPPRCTCTMVGKKFPTS